MSVFPLFVIDTWHSLHRKLFRRLWITFVDNFVLRMFDFAEKHAGAVVWQWVPTFKEAVTPRDDITVHTVGYCIISELFLLCISYSVSKNLVIIH